ncbi:MAG: radical SAM protein [Chrysiogenetes bacterium]|nr:radical SAM protein [Chrysiogenetes bacterium]
MLMISDLLELARGGGVPGPASEAGRGRYSTNASPVIVWNVINHCNMSCPHCYAAAIHKPDPDDLTGEEGRKLLKELAGLEVPAVIFSGGEPLLRKDIFDLIAYAKELGHRPHLSSNGVMIDRDTARRLREVGIDYVGISIDGMPGFNDEYRGYEHGFERAFRGAEYCLEEGLKVGIRMTVSKKNRDQFDELLDHVIALKIPRFYVSHLVYAGRAHEDHGYDLSPEENREMVRHIFERADALLDQKSATRIVSGANDADGPFLYFYALERHGELGARRLLNRLKARTGNTAGERILNIDNRGNVHPDQFWSEACLGNVRHSSFTEIMKNPLLEQLRHREDYLQGKCGSCRFKPACRGSHRERSLAVGTGLWGSDPSCYLTESEVQGVSPWDARVAQS